jgi:hypothetical protein
MNEAILGGIAVACLAIGLVFFRFWRSTKDVFFVYFMGSFWIQAANHAVRAMTHSWDQDTPSQYLVQLLSYALILVAIWSKNRPPS